MPRVVVAAACFAGRKALSIGIMLIATLASASVAAQSRNDASAETRTVTLITGDRVVIGGGEQPTVSVQPRKGREGIAFSTTYQRLNKGRRQGSSNHLFVIPADALPFIGSGRLDRQLFNVTTLLESHYYDGAVDHVPVVVTYKQNAGAAFVTRASLSGAAITNRFDSVNGVAAKIDKEEAGHFWDDLTSGTSAVGALSAQNSSVRRIWLDRLLQPALDASVPQIGAPTAWQSGYDGTGVVVAIIDSGIDTSHPDLVGKVLAEKNFIDTADGDQSGHGTHVASIVAGTGAASNGQYRGVAPGAQLISAKVCNLWGCSMSSILAAMHWTVTEQGAKLINMSLSGELNTPEVDPLEEAVDQLTAQYGALFVVTAGNNGQPLPYPGALGIESPGSAASALTVGAVDRNGQMADFSSRGPLRGDYRIKPDITAPGVNIVAARGDGTRVGEPVGDWYATASGTSMAAPHVAGTAAILIQRHPDWSPQQLKSALMSTARFNQAATVIDQGAGFIDVPAALATSLVSDTASMSLGFAEFPHEDDPILTRTITYRNTGNAAASLTLQLDVRGPNGAAVPAGMFTLDRTAVTVPAGGTTAVTLTTNTRISAAYGLFTGRLVATEGGKTFAIPFGIYREEELYNFALKHIDRNGAPAAAFYTTLVPLDQRMFITPTVSGDGSNADTTVRLPPGRYVVQTQFSNDNGTGSTLLLHPGFVLNASASLTLDARNATPLTIAAPTATAHGFWFRTEYEASAVWGTHTHGIQWMNLDSQTMPPIYTGVLGQPANHVRSYVTQQWSDGSSATGDAALYAAAFTQNGTLPTGSKTIPASEMSIVRARYAPAPADSRNPYALGSMGIGVDAPGNAPVHVVFDRGGFLPQQRTEYYYSNTSDVRWSNELGANFLTLDAPSKKYQPGQMIFSRWNEAPFAPALPNYNPEVLWSYRTGNTMTVEVPLLADRQSHLSSVGLLRTNALAVYRNGELIGDVQYPQGASEFVVPPEPATYRVEATVAQGDYDPGLRQTILGLSTQVTGAWTFQSGHVATGRTQLPLMTVRFKPTLNEHSEAVRGTLLEVPVSVYQLDRQGAVDVQTLTIEASFDDGISWSEVQLERNGSEWTANVQHPLDASFVSLRATAQGLSTNSAQITVIRAYALTDPAPSAR